MTRLVIVLSLLSLLALGCKKGPVTKLQAAPAPQLESGWTTFDAGTFTIAGPSNYKSKPPPAIMMPGMEEPVVANAVENVGSGKTEGVVLRLFDWSVKPTVGEEVTRVEVKREPGNNDLASAIESTKRSSGIKEYEKVQLPVGEAALFKSTTTSVGGDDMHEVIYTVSHNGDMYQFAWHVTTLPRQHIEGPAAQMMQTFRVK